MSSSSDDYITHLLSIQGYLYRIGNLILMILGSISCILSIIVFTKKNLRKNPCSMYLLSSSISNILYIYSSMLFSMFTNGYTISLSENTLIGCRFAFYFSFLFDILSPFYLILAGIDRILLTSHDARIRRRSTCRLAYICIILGTLFWMLFHIHTFIYTELLQVSPNYSVCYFQPGLYTILMGYYSLIIKGILVPSALIIFGLWTIANIRSIRMRVVHVTPSTANNGNINLPVIQPKDRQFIFMLLVDIIIYVFFTAMLSVVVIYQQITFNAQKTAEQTEKDLFIRNVAVFSTYFPFCVGCCGYLLVSKTFRGEFKKIFVRR